MSPWLFIIYVDLLFEKATVGDLGARQKLRGMKQCLMAGFFAGNAFQLAENKRMLKRTVGIFDSE